MWQSGREVVQCGTIGDWFCQECQAERPFAAVLTYQYGVLFRIFGLLSRRQYQVACEVCQHPVKLSRHQIETELLPAVPIPFMRRYGLALVGTGTLLLVLVLLLP